MLNVSPDLVSQGRPANSTISTVSLSRLPVPAHIVHETAQGTLTVIAWLALGVSLTAIGGLTAARATTARRVSVGIGLTIAGVTVLAVGVWFHGSTRV